MSSVKERLNQLLKEETEAPTLPEVGIRAMQIALDDSLAQKKLVQLIMRYPDIAARVVRLANSPLFGLSGRISSVERAVNLLGIAPIRSLVLSLSVIRAMDKKRKQIMAPLYRRIQDNSFACGIAARLIAKTTGYKRSDEAFLTGLLYHIGYFFILSQIQEEDHFRLIASHLSNPFAPELEKKEREVFGFSHAEFGGLIATRWFLPQHIVTSIQNHHEDIKKVSLNERAETLTSMIQGSILLNTIFDQGERDGDSQKLAAFLEETLGIPTDACDNVLLEFSQRLSEESSLFKLPVKPRKSYLNVLRESNQKLYEISLDYIKVLEEKKKLDRENEETARILKALFDHSPDIIVVLDRLGKPVMINQAMERLTGIPVEEFMSGRQSLLRYYPTAREVMRVLRSDQYGPPGLISDYETYVLDYKKRKILVSFSGALLEEDGKVKMTIGFVRDIRKRKALELELVNSKRYLDLIFNTMADGIRVIDQTMTIIFENERMKEMLGHGVGKKCYQTHFQGQVGREGPCEDCPAFPVKKGGVFSKEISDARGRTYMVSSTVLDMHGEPPAVLQVIRDISPLKEAQRLAIDQHKLKGIMELAGAMAHELNQPLTSISMGLEIISRQTQNRRPIPPEAIRDTMQSVEKMSAIIKKLSEITQYETRDYVEAMKILDIDGSSRKS